MVACTFMFAFPRIYRLMNVFFYLLSTNQVASNKHQNVESKVKVRFYALIKLAKALTSIQVLMSVPDLNPC